MIIITPVTTNRFLCMFLLAIPPIFVHSNPAIRIIRQRGGMRVFGKTPLFTQPCSAAVRSSCNNPLWRVSRLLWLHPGGRDSRS